MPKSLCLYSTNPWIKWHICHKFRGDMHYVWCCEYFSPESLGLDHVGSLIPPTSSPCAIYKDLAGAVRSSFDKHNEKIIGQRARLLVQTEKWRAAGDITESDAAEIAEMLNAQDGFIWRPLLYIIPRGGIEPSRIKRVPDTQRAGPGPEYIIEDLSGNEFERIRFDG